MSTLDDMAVEDLQEEVNSLRTDNERLRAALRRYGQHADECGTWGEVEGWGRTGCTCGYSAALDAALGEGEA